MSGRELDPDPGLALGDDREGERNDIDAVAEHVVGDHRRLPGPVLAWEHHRRDGVRAGQQVEAGRRHQLPEERAVGAQGRSGLTGGCHEIEGGQRAGDDGRGDRVGEQVGTRALTQQVDHFPVARDVATGGTAEGLAQRAGDDVDPVGDAEELRRPPAALPDEPDGVRVVDEDHRGILLREVADLREWRVGAVHREDPVGDNDDPASPAARAASNWTRRSAMSALR
jgi:hypothetical protein